MGTKHSIKISKPDDPTFSIEVATGRSVVIIGANGSGKTRLGVQVEANVKPVVRISAHKSLALNKAVELTSLDRAEKSLRFGLPEGSESNKHGFRWGNNPAVHQLNDFDALLQCLFAEHNRTAVDFLTLAEKDRTTPVPTSRLRQLKAVWDDLLPHRVLELREATIEVIVKTGGQSYAGSDMSDGERAIFYFLGQSLMAPGNSVIVVDEPEGHVHKAILGPLWDAIESARPDCGFLYITHDLDFAVTRPAAAKYFIRSYIHNPQAWDIAELPRDTGLPENVVAEIVGSRKPILFVEGERGSLDVTLYRHHYSAFTIVPVGSCNAVVHSVATYKRSGELHWLEAHGLIDADHRSPESIAELAAKRVHVLPVAEVENLLLLPNVFSAVAEALALDPADTLKKLTDKVLQVAAGLAESTSARYASRRLDERLKRIVNAAQDLATLQTSYNRELASINPTEMFEEFKTMFDKAIADRDLRLVLKLFDNKTLPSIAANALGLRDNSEGLMDRVERLLGDATKGKAIRAALEEALPTISVQPTVARTQNDPPSVTHE